MTQDHAIKALIEMGRRADQQQVAEAVNDLIRTIATAQRPESKALACGLARLLVNLHLPSGPKEELLRRISEASGGQGVSDDMIHQAQERIERVTRQTRDAAIAEARRRLIL